MPNIEVNIVLIKTLLFLPILLLSFTVHEFSHAAVAKYSGDNTATNQGRFTLNPLKHLDLIGSIVLPLVTMLSGGFVIGWAKPVPVNPNNFKNVRLNDILVSISGPFANLLLAFFLSVVVKHIPSQNVLIKELLFTAIYFNVFLFVFNILPLPPLDGYHILRRIIKVNSVNHLRVIESMGPLILIILIFSPAWDYIYRIIRYIVEVLL